MTLDDIRRLNIREVGNWPLLPRIAVLLLIFIAILAAGAALDWKDRYDELDRAKQEEAKLKEQYATKKAKAINYDIYVQQLKEIEQSFGALLKQLPNKAEMDALLTDINQAGLGRGLQFELFKPAAQERIADFYAELPIARQDHRQLSRHGRVRERRRAAAAHRHAERRRDRERQGRAHDGRRGQDLPLPRRGRGRQAAQGGEGREGQGEGEEMKRWLALAVGACLALAGCGGESHQDLRAWMADQGKGARGRVDPLPQIRPYEPFAYNAFDLPDPFKPRKIEPTKGGSKLAPDLTRRREPLEAYPLESLNMVGTLAKGKTMYALVRTPDKDVYQVTQGNYLGQNFGVITGITDGEVRLKELVQDGSGDWTERTGTLQLIQADTKTQERRK